MAPYKRSDFNDLIDEVNDIITDPPDGCDPLPAIDHVPEMTIWAKSHIRELQDALIETCPEIEFDDIDDLWRQSTIDEIRDKFGQAWCDCECDPQQEAGTIIELGTFEPVVFSNCPGYPDAFNPPYPRACDFDGFQIAIEGICGRRWQLRRNGLTIKSSSINCDGTINCNPNTTGGNPLIGPTGIAVICTSGGPPDLTGCGTAFCESQLADAEASIASNPELYPTYTFTVHILTNNAYCCECP